MQTKPWYYNKLNKRNFFSYYAILPFVCNNMVLFLIRSPIKFKMNTISKSAIFLNFQLYWNVNCIGLHNLYSYIILNTSNHIYQATKQYLGIYFHSMLFNVSMLNISEHSARSLNIKYTTYINMSILFFTQNINIQQCCHKITNKWSHVLEVLVNWNCGDPKTIE